MRRSAFLLLMLVGVPTPHLTPLAAQSTSERAALRLLQDSLSYFSDTTALLALEARGIEAARSRREDAVVHLRLGLIALRLAELRGGRHWDDAYGEFQWASELRPEWPWPWHGVGLTAGRAPNKAEGFAGGLFAMIGEDRHRLAGEAFARAVAADPTFTEGLREFAITAREASIDAPVDGALTALRTAMRSPVAWDGELLLELGRLERLAGSPDSAVVAFRRAVQVGMRSDIAWLELARTYPLLAEDSLSGAGDARPSVAAYFAGARSDARDVVAMYRRDIEPIVEDAVLLEFDAHHGAERVAWLREFWRNRDALELRPSGERLAEHYRRWQVARTEFRLAPFRRRYLVGLEVFRSGDRELDDRGIVFLRHGEPTRRVIWPSERRANTQVLLTRTYGSETWHYRRPDGDMVLHFLARDDQADYRAVESVLSLDVALDQLEASASLVPGLSRLLYAGQYTRDFLVEEERRRGRQSIAVATQSDSWERQFATLLKSRIQWYSVGISREGPLVHLVYTVDAEAVRDLPGTGPVPVTLRGGFFTSDGVAIAVIDTVQYLLRPAADVRQLALRAEVAVPAGRYKVRVGVEVAPTVGAIFPVDSLRVPAVTGDSLELSALLVGMQSQGLSWVVPGPDTVWFDPLAVYGGHDTITVYAEAYGVDPTEEYAIRITVTRQRGALSRLLKGRGETIALTERRTFGRGPAQLRRALAFGGLAPGNYVLEVVMEGKGMSSTRSRGLVIRE